MVKFSLPLCCESVLTDYFWFYLFFSLYGEASEEEIVCLIQQWLVSVIKVQTENVICLADVGKPESHFTSRIRWPFSWIYSVCYTVERCMSVMQSGTQMVKLKSGTKGLVRLFYLDEHRTCIRWRPSRKSEKAKSKLLIFILISGAVQC